MSAPSFSSFPSFTSFPDLDPGPSKRASTLGEQSTDDSKKREKKRRGKDERDRKEKKHTRDKHRHSPDRHASRQSEDIAYSGIDDERVKAREDNSIRAEKSYTATIDKEQLPYYTDRKGDPSSRLLITSDRIEPITSWTGRELSGVK